MYIYIYMYIHLVDLNDKLQSVTKNRVTN